MRFSKNGCLPLHACDVRQPYSLVEDFYLRHLLLLDYGILTEHCRPNLFSPIRGILNFHDSPELMESLCRISGPSGEEPFTSLLFFLLLDL